MKVIFSFGLLIFAAITILLIFQLSGKDPSQLAYEPITNLTSEKILVLLQSIDSKLDKLSEGAQAVSASAERRSAAKTTDIEEIREDIDSLKAAFAGFSKEMQTQRPADESRKRYQDIADYFDSIGETKNTQALEELFHLWNVDVSEASRSVKFKWQIEIAKTFGRPDEITRGSYNQEQWRYYFSKGECLFSFLDGFVHSLAIYPSNY